MSYVRFGDSEFWTRGTAVSPKICGCSNSRREQKLFSTDVHHEKFHDEIEWRFQFSHFELCLFGGIDQYAKQQLGSYYS